MNTKKIVFGIILSVIGLMAMVLPCISIQPSGGGSSFNWNMFDLFDMKDSYPVFGALALIFGIAGIAFTLVGCFVHKKVFGILGGIFVLVELDFLTAAGITAYMDIQNAGLTDYLVVPLGIVYFLLGVGMAIPFFIFVGKDRG